MTKGEAEGTELGLSICHGVVHQTGGYMQVESEPGKGTTFHVYLPRIHGIGESCQSIQHDAGADEGGARPCWSRSRVY